MAAQGTSGFSDAGIYYASCGADGKLKIWESSQNILKQEYTPNLHLTSPCTCLLWIVTSKTPNAEVQSKKKKKKLGNGGLNVVAMGTTDGRILLYSIATAAVECQLEGGHGNASIKCLSWHPGTNMYSCGNSTIAEWSLAEGKPISKWNAHTDPIHSISVSPDGKWVLSASRSIKCWDAKTHALTRTFTGHASPVLTLTFIPKPNSSRDYYFLSTAKGDRYINAWTLNKDTESKSPVVSMVMESEPTGQVAVHAGQEPNIVSVAVITGIGNMQLFSHQLNGQCVKPLKPSVTVQVATDSSRGKEAVEPIPIVSTTFTSDGSLKLAYGHGSFLSFENLAPELSEKLQVLVRQDPRRFHLGAEGNSSKVRVPESNDSQYIQPSSTHAVVAGMKRSHSRQAEVPMEERLENLSLSMARADEKTGGLPRADNLSQLLLQALKSKDRSILHIVLLRKDEEVLKNTVKRLPLQMIDSLVKELTTLLHAKTATAQAAARWLRVVLSIHSAHLMANPSLVEVLAPVLGLVESRLALLPALSRLSGRLELLSSQLDAASGTDENATSLDMQTSLLVYQDADTSDDESSPEELGGLGSESDDHWEELSDTNSEDDEGGDDDEDVDMSS